MNTNSLFGQQHGRLGNQIFQLGHLFAVAQRRGHDFYLPRDGESLWDCFDLDIPAQGPECIHHFKEKNGACNYDHRVFEQPEGTCYRGFFQSYRYFQEYKAALVALLRFKFRYRALSETLLFAYRRGHQRPLVSLHVRRGDYLNTDNVPRFGNLGQEGYYEQAVRSIGDDVTYLVFSDDIEWCRRSLKLERAEFVDHDPCTSLCLMTKCDVNVVANSSFSWWGAYLNPMSDVYAPSRWFAATMPAPNDLQLDVIPPAWRTIPVFADRADRATPSPGLYG